MQSVTANDDLRLDADYVGFSDGIADQIADSGATGIAIGIVAAFSFLWIAAGALAWWAGW